MEYVHNKQYTTCLLNDVKLAHTELGTSQHT